MAMEAIAKGRFTLEERSLLQVDGAGQALGEMQLRTE